MSGQERNEAMSEELSEAERCLAIRSPTHRAIFEVIRDHRMGNMADEDGYGYPLVDLMSNPAPCDISTGEAEMITLTDEIAAALATPQPAEARGMVEVASIYIAARFSRRHEAHALAKQLMARGHKITSLCVKPEADHVLPTGISAQAADAERQRFALEDCDDVRAANWTISLMEEPRSNTRGGRHIEFGMAVALGHRLTIIGPRETVFHHLPNVEHYETVEAFTAALSATLSPQAGGEPVMYASPEQVKLLTDPDASDGYHAEAGKYLPMRKTPAGQFTMPLYASPPAPADNVGLVERDKLIELLTAELGDSYDCGRVWEAWSVGTMGEDDFTPVNDRVEEIADGILSALRANGAERP